MCVCNMPRFWIKAIIFLGTKSDPLGYKEPGGWIQAIIVLGTNEFYLILKIEQDLYLKKVTRWDTKNQEVWMK